ncbi:hypothetical protein IEQ34_027079 [Dendrobium chrysotoxum]|uniref:Uncharacterized protein n=1 Tax=Dendrobium chrysotoxum TaxID=161865 RepID=A0AAV7FI52_DENCH|nr:hypothetical protein IEQ34_027079 [Dendrobium chrysotoxum]
MSSEISLEENLPAVPPEKTLFPLLALFTIVLLFISFLFCSRSRELRLAEHRLCCLRTPLPMPSFSASASRTTQYRGGLPTAATILLIQNHCYVPILLIYLTCPSSRSTFSRVCPLGYFNSEKAEEDPMVISSSARVLERKLVVRGRTILSSVPGNVISSSVVSSGPVEVFFLGAQLSDLSSGHVVSLEILRWSLFLKCGIHSLWNTRILRLKRAEAIKKANGHLFHEEVILSRRFPKFWLPIYVLTGDCPGRYSHRPGRSSKNRNPN